MEQKIWRNLIQILAYRNDLIGKNKPFMEQLYNKSINKAYDLNDDNYISFLQTLPRFHLEVLHTNGIIEDKKYLKVLNPFSLSNNNQNQEIEQIIKKDNMEELKRLILEQGIGSINTITTSFNEVKRMKSPIMIYCIIHKAMKCFKYLLLNDHVDPTKTMEEENPDRLWYNQHRYKWDWMATAIYYKEIEIMKILEERGFEKGDKLSHIEAAVLSFRKSFVKEIINKNEGKDEIQDILMKGILTAIKIKYFKGIELIFQKGNANKIPLVFESSITPIHFAVGINSKDVVELLILISKGADINAKDIVYSILKFIFLIKIIQNR